MAITFEEITGEVAPEPRPEASDRDTEGGEVDEGAVHEQVRAALRRERLRATRLSDR